MPLPRKVSRRRVTEVCRQYEPLVLASAWAFRPRVRSLPIQDLIQEGYVALCEAAHSFPSYRGKYARDFGAYAKARVVSRLREVTLVGQLPVTISPVTAWRLFQRGELYDAYGQEHQSASPYLQDAVHLAPLRGLTEEYQERLRDVDPAALRHLLRLWMLDRSNGTEQGAARAIARGSGTKARDLEREVGFPMRAILPAAFSVFRTSARVREVLRVSEMTLCRWARRFCQAPVRRLRREAVDS